MDGASNFRKYCVLSISGVGPPRLPPEKARKFDVNAAKIKKTQLLDFPGGLTGVPRVIDSFHSIVKHSCLFSVDSLNDFIRVLEVGYLGAASRVLPPTDAVTRSPDTMLEEAVLPPTARCRQQGAGLDPAQKWKCCRRSTVP